MLWTQGMGAFLPVEFRLPCGDLRPYPTLRAVGAGKPYQPLAMMIRADLVLQLYVSGITEDATLI